MTTKWTPIYQVRRDGTVWRYTKWRSKGWRWVQCAAHPDRFGYLRIHLVNRVTGARQNVKVHSLVAREYLPAPPSIKHQIRHLNGDQTDNRADNLAWGTAKDNADDREKHGRTCRGQKHPKTKLSEDQKLHLKRADKPAFGYWEKLATSWGVTSEALRYWRRKYGH